MRKKFLILLLCVGYTAFGAEKAFEEQIKTPVCLKALNPGKLNLVDETGWDRKVKYFHTFVETKDRTTYNRDNFGSITIKINPRETETVTMGGVEFKSPRRIDGASIDIGSFHVDYTQSTEEFLQTIAMNCEIKYKCFG